MDGITSLSSALSTRPPVLPRQMSLNKTAGLTEAEKLKINKTAQDFEAVFLSQMMEHMFADIDLDPTADGPGEDIYKSMMIDEYGKIFAKAGGIGIADHVRNEMLKQQEIR